MNVINVLRTMMKVNETTRMKAVWWWKGECSQERVKSYSDSISLKGLAMGRGSGIGGEDVNSSCRRLVAFGGR